ncbi:MAG: hypothetical protein NUW22_11715, partial [Acidobacteria bacterium]|nr:hypothetical protein [Acidobacteriota bacterium]
MATINPGNDRRAQLTAVISEVRRRWRMKLALRGGALVMGGTALVLLGSALGIDALRFSPSAIWAFRVAALVVVLALIAVWIVRPMRRRVTDSQVALYVEEHEPSLEASILSAVETVETAGSSASPALVEKLVEQAIEQCRTLNASRTIGQKARRRFATAIVAVVLALTAAFTLGPESLRQGLSALLVIIPAEAASPYAIEVLPGNVTAPRGSDQNVKARLVNFSSDEVVLMMRTGTEGDYQRVPLVRGLESGMFEGMLFDLMLNVEYYIESDGVRSNTYLMTLVDLPAVKTLDLEYRFPAYTRLPPQVVEGGGDVASLKGTTVGLNIESTMPTTGGRIVMGDDRTMPLTVQPDGRLTGSFVVDKKGFYRIELEGPNREAVAASPSYTIDVIEDMAPTVKFVKPGRDTAASAVEEVFLEARADDDYGVKALDLVYSVNGGEEKTVRMYAAGETPRAEVSAGHTVYLEELNVKVGDSVSYYARVSDNDGVSGGKVTTSDIYFVKIRPFQQAFRPGQSAEGGGGGGGGGGGQQEQGALSEKQRQIVSATFNLQRDKARRPLEQFKEDAVVVALSQSKLRDEVAGLIQQMTQRLGGDADFQPIAQSLKKASEAMVLAEKHLRDQKVKEALSPEQTALKHLQDAETTYEAEVRERQQQQGGGGGGGGGGQMAEDLADLFELERDRLANQYELQQRANEQNAPQGGGGGEADQEVDEVAKRLKELAERQLQEAERQRRQSAARQGASGTGSGQRQLAEELEELARQLEKLSRDQQREQAQRQQLAEEARRLQEAANTARRSAAANQQDAGSQASAAAQQLQEAQRRLRNATGGNPQQAVQDAQRRAQELVQEQKAVQQQVQNLPQPGAGREEQIKALGERKDQMEQKVAGLQKQLDSAAGQMRGDQRDAANTLREASAGIRNDQVQEKIRYSKGALSGNAEYSRGYEQEIANNLQELQNTIGQASEAMNQSMRQNAQTQALDQARNLLRGLESLNDRMQQEQQGQQGELGQGGREGQQGGRGQQMGDGRGQPNDGLQRNPSLRGGPGGDARNTGQQYSAEAIRQFRREVAERANDAQALR